MFCHNPATDRLNVKYRQRVHFVQVNIRKIIYLNRGER